MVSVASISCVSAGWAIGAGGPGVSKLWFQELLDASARQAAVDSVRALLSNLVTFLRTDWNITVSTTIQNFSLETGQLLNEVTAGTQPATIQGAAVATTGYQAGVGGRLIWKTGVVLDGRKVIGRTFLVPLVTFTTSNGIPSGTFNSTMKTACTAYATQVAARPVVWHKRFGPPPAPDEPPPYLSGNAVVINAGDPALTVSSLRSRRY